MSLCFSETWEPFSWGWTASHTPCLTQASERAPRGSLEFNSNQFRRVPSMFYYQQFRKAVWINKAAVSLNYQYIKMDLWTTKDCLAELLLSALFHRENWTSFLKGFLWKCNLSNQTFLKTQWIISGCTGSIVSGGERSLPQDLKHKALGIHGLGQQAPEGDLYDVVCHWDDSISKQGHLVTVWKLTGKLSE